MNLTDQTVIDENNVTLAGSQDAALMSITITPMDNVVAPNSNELIISVGGRDAILSRPNAEIRNYVYTLSRPLCSTDELSGRFVQRAEIIDNDVKVRAYVEWEDEDSTIEELEPLDIMLFKGPNLISTNYQNVEIEVIYPRDNVLNRNYLNTTLYNSYKKLNNQLSNGDFYFKDAFTKMGNELNLEVNNINIDCITSRNNNFSLDSEGNLVVNSITTNQTGSIGGTNVNNGDICDLIYPVGSIYMSVNNVNPSNLFGGVWQQVKDRFLLGSGDIYTNAETGGEATHILSVNELPNHSHGIPSLSGSTNTTGNHSHAVIGTSANNGGSGIFCETWGNRSNDRNGSTSSAGNHSHTVTTNASNTNATGSDVAHNNMPPYLVVNMWKRVA